jgi:hypothetical protein
MEDAKKEAMIEHLVMQGAIQFAGIDENTNEMLYSITDKLKEVHPELFEELSDQFEHHMFKLIEQGPKTMTWRLR